MGQFLFRECGNQRHQTGDARTIIAPQSGGALGHNAAAGAFGDSPRAQGDSVQVCHEQAAWTAYLARQVNDQVACLSWQRDFFMGPINAYLPRRHADVLERRG